MFLLARECDLTIQTLQSLGNGRKIRFQIDGFDGAAILLSVSAPCYRLAGFLVGGATTLGFAFIPELLAFSQGKFNFYFTVLEIHPCRDQRQALLLSLADQPADFFSVHEKLPRTQRSVIKDV